MKNVKKVQSVCPICKTQKRINWMEHKLVCMECDELTFDLAIEAEQTTTDAETEEPTREGIHLHGLKKAA